MCHCFLAVLGGCYISALCLWEPCSWNGTLPISPIFCLLLNNIFRQQNRMELLRYCINSGVPNGENTKISSIIFVKVDLIRPIITQWIFSKIQQTVLRVITYSIWPCYKGTGPYKPHVQESIRIIVWETVEGIQNIIIPAASKNLKGGCTDFTSSVHPYVRPSVDGIMSALYLQQYSLDLFHINTYCQVTWECVPHVRFLQI